MMFNFALQEITAASSIWKKVGTMQLKHNGTIGAYMATLTMLGLLPTASTSHVETCLPHFHNVPNTAVVQRK